ncbi:metalloregulator ArsR/SmtB family transcription factor [Microbacterium sp. STN6]|uniref:ArsR/SmtB family transcription factor n=1 Tax=Microbacterium sp. STN6 TaxID=2995588 RepID=UPI002260F53E|nr:metalloregulator ArsR/SmtB family transcription factor [Microbacterium sp. STN6]MCX7520669.1 metalloregulator ArsR/SmtB family transcription factor [Microbacterium sp. STN6]
MADIFDVVADATRRDILKVLHDRGVQGAGEAGEISVSEIVGALELSQPTVSKHLKVLREAGLVTVREKGQHRYYSLDIAPLETIEDWLMPLVDTGKGEPYVEVLGGEAREFAGVVGKVIADTSHRFGSAVERVTPKKWRKEL